MVATGSLFNTQFSNDLYADKKALRVGDIITVVLRETTQATKAANSTLEKDSEVSVDPLIGLGEMPLILVTMPSSFHRARPLPLKETHKLTSLIAYLVIFPSMWRVFYLMAT